MADRFIFSHRSMVPMAAMMLAGCGPDSPAKTSQESPADWAFDSLFVKNGQARRRAYELCAKNWKSVHPVAVRHVQHADERRRHAGVYLLSRLGDTADLPVLRQALSDRVLNVRSAALHGVVRLRDQQSVPVLLAQLEIASFAERKSILTALITLDAKSAQQCCGDLARHQSWAHRRSAAQALSRFDDPTTRQQLLELLRDSVWMVRSDAAEALAARSDRASLPELRRLQIHDEDARVRESAKRAIERLAQPAGRPRSGG